MNTFKLKVATPDGTVFEGDVNRLDLRGIEGELAVMSGHTPFITAVKDGACRMLLPDGTERTAKLDGGLLNVGGKTVTLLVSGYHTK